MANVIETVFRGVDEISGNVAKINTSVGAMEQKFISAGSAVKSTLAAFGVGFSLVGLVAFTKSAIDTADAIGELSKQAGFGAERFQRLQFAFAQSGVRAGEFESGMRQLNTRLGQFLTTGAGPAAKAIEELGLTQDVASGKISTAQQLFEAYLKSITKIDSAAKAAAISTQLFGREAGSKIAASAREGKDAVDKMAEAARGVFSDEQVRRADQLNDKLVLMAKTVGGSLKGAFVDLGYEIGKALGLVQTTDINDKIAELQRSLEQKGAGFRSTDVGKAEQQRLDALIKQRKLDQLDEYLAGSEPTGLITKGEFAGKEMTNSEKLNYAKLIGFNIKNIKAEAIDANSDVDDVVAYMKKQREKLGLKSFGADGFLLEDVNVTAKEATSFGDLSQNVRDREKTRGLAFPTWSQEQSRAFDEMTDKIRKGRESMKEFADATAAAFESAAWQALVDGKPRDALKGLILDMGQLIFKMAVMKPLAENLGKTFQSWGGNGDGDGGGFFSGGGDSGFWGNILGALFGGKAGDGLASGGWTTGLNRVNEQGDEFLLTGNRGRVVPLGKAAANGVQMGGMTYAPVTNNSFNTNIDPGTLEIIMRRRDAQNLAAWQQLAKDGLLV